MPRSARIAPGDMVFHCLNRGNDRRELFVDDADYAAFERVLECALDAVPVRLLAYCLMPNHWHLLLWPRKDGELGEEKGRHTVYLTTSPVSYLRNMPRSARIAPGDMVFHCLNRGNDRRELFVDDADYAAFERVLECALDAVPVRLLAYCLMPNHWHLLLWPRKDGELGRFMQRLTTTHVRRWHTHRHTEGRGHIYQGVYKAAGAGNAV